MCELHAVAGQSLPSDGRALRFALSERSVGAAGGLSIQTAIGRRIGSGDPVYSEWTDGFEWPDAELVDAEFRRPFASDGEHPE